MSRINPKGPHLPEGEKAPSQVIEFPSEKTALSRIGPTTWECSNDVTWKLLSSGAGRVALGYVIDTGWPGSKSKWLARVGDRSYGPASLDDAKSACEAMVRRPQSVDSVITVTAAKSIKRLNGMAARFLDGAEPAVTTRLTEAVFDPLVLVGSGHRYSNPVRIGRDLCSAIIDAEVGQSDERYQGWAA